MADPSPSADLLSRLLARVTIEDDGAAAQRDVLRCAVAQMLESATARELAERFVAEDAQGLLRFRSVDGSRIHEHDAGRAVRGARGFSTWDDGRIAVDVNEAYRTASAACRAEDLPATLAHELLGHGLWYARAERAGIRQGLHHHESNETNARLVGWLVDLELDGRIETGRWARSYLADPAAHLAELKLVLPYYALTFSTDEMRRPAETLAARLRATLDRRAEIATQLANHRSWNPVIDHFVRHHGVDEARLAALRAAMADGDGDMEAKLAQLDAIAAEIAGTLDRLRAETDRTSENYLVWVAEHPLIATLAREAADNDRRLRERIAALGSDPFAGTAEANPFAGPQWHGQITFDELVAMCRRDREEHPEHWAV